MSTNVEPPATVEKNVNTTGGTTPDSSDSPRSEARFEDEIPYTIFTPWERKFIVLAASLSAIFSPMSTTIYLPALNQLASDLHVSDAQINLTVTTFLILQGLAPALIAGFSDTAGRRPAYMICFTLYLAANIGLAIQRNYAALLVLRCLQSAGSSGTVALAQGVVADIVTSAERGKYVGWTSATSIAGPILGPILGGLLAQYGGWPWIFYFLIILTGAFLVPFVLFFPETCRKVVGDGSVPPPKLNMCLTNVIKERSRKKAGIEIDTQQSEEVRRNYKLSIPNPLSTFKIVADKESALILFSSGLVVACLYAVNTALPSQFKKIYGFDEIQIGLCFLPFGAGSIISAFTTGKMIDFSWRRHAKRAGFPVMKNRHQDLTHFPIERARLVVALPLLYFCCAGLITYGWVLDFETSLAGPLVVLFFTGYGIMAGFQIMIILIVDLSPGNAAAATAANNIFRCLIGAGATAAIVPMIDAWNVGWAYTFAAFTWIALSPMLLVLLKYGPRMRLAKKEKLAQSISQHGEMPVERRTDDSHVGMTRTRRLEEGIAADDKAPEPVRNADAKA
ncbi:uncharacterized protein KY384_008502 [Bacidia gigantensis]|uniref:uncharacterized protein n=1 Tax=Bacidia gigantensis TaxID=2732470 RepID=UPI001D040888|nr:uncharacterized protein KY384_008502 [Bacidia gigantensis]KAG8527073.1 hypothetical protein KY384_008502 [Bacidia gigantensis]